jgi:hypothetical protein
MTNPYRAMCAELAEELVNEYGYCTEWEKGLPLCESNVSELLTRARALLAQPVAEGPTDEELWAAGSDDFRANCYPTDAIAYARAVLAKWGHPTLQPVAVSERLPEPEDCDEQGRCWVGGGQLVSGFSTWILGYSAWASRFPDVHYCWLPANALPIPRAGGPR